MVFDQKEIIPDAFSHFVKELIVSPGCDHPGGVVSFFLEKVLPQLGKQTCNLCLNLIDCFFRLGYQCTSRSDGLYGL